MSRVPKRSFVALHPPLDVGALLAEVTALPAAAWRPSYWGSPHCSVEQVLLRGGTADDPSDFLAEQVEDRDPLQAMPHTRALVGPDGPFGGAHFAFLFRMEPDGVSLAHADDAPIWHGLHRVHIPLITHPDAALVVEGRVQHLAVGSAWTFDNQALHGFANGPVRRLHLILDVPPGPTMDRLLADGTVHPGRHDPTVAARTLETHRRRASYPGDGFLRGLVQAMIEAHWTEDDVLAWLTEQQVPSPHGAPWDPATVRRFSAP